ncbi:UNVERIFIED_CONTAM: hypothetical protein PYX00_003824 [Menopon gallinae]|uniref:Uncharacterized protein n=1 Tax=Menopon gallinae TaxID=328185 RepID=A0AAW2I2G4_9NEOP
MLVVRPSAKRGSVEHSRGRHRKYKDESFADGAEEVQYERDGHYYGSYRKYKDESFADGLECPPRAEEVFVGELVPDEWVAAEETAAQDVRDSLRNGIVARATLTSLVEEKTDVRLVHWYDQDLDKIQVWGWKNRIVQLQTDDHRPAQGRVNLVREVTLSAVYPRREGGKLRRYKSIPEQPKLRRVDHASRAIIYD